MSLYNMLFGKNDGYEELLQKIGIEENDIERFRDCYADGDYICVYTRTGGGNREDCPNEILTNNQYYVFDKDDEFDCTYATFYFQVPKQ